MLDLLPDETLFQIFGQIHIQASLYPATLVCKKWCGIAREIMWREISLRTPVMAIRFIKYASPLNFHFIRKIKVGGMLSNSDFSQKLASILPKCPNLENLVLRNRTIVCALVDALPKCVSLRKLILGGQVSGVQNLAKAISKMASKLDRIELDDLQPFRNIPNSIENLFLAISKHKNLSKIKIKTKYGSYPTIPLQWIEGLLELKDLEIAAPIKYEDLGILFSCPKLISLTLQCKSIGRDFSDLNRLSVTGEPAQLRKMIIKNSIISDAEMASLVSHAPKLEYIDISHNKFIGHNSIRQISYLGDRLRSLYLRQVDLIGRDLETIFLTCNNIQNLSLRIHLDDAESITNILANHCLELKCLELEGIRRDNQIPYINFYPLMEVLRNLHSLILESVGIIMGAFRGGTLRVLSVDRCRVLNMTDMENIIQANLLLKKLFLNLESISEKIESGFFANLDSLIWLEISGCSKFSLKDLERMLKPINQTLRILRLNGIFKNKYDYMGFLHLLTGLNNLEEIYVDNHDSLLLLYLKNAFPHMKVNVIGPRGVQ